MFMSVTGAKPSASLYGELAGARVLITGLSPSAGVDLARAFAEHKCRLVVQTNGASPEIAELAAVLAQSASEMKLFTDPFASSDEAMKFTQNAAQGFSGLDVVVNLVRIEREDLAGRASLEDIEDLVTAKLSPAMAITQVAANRMRLTWTKGLVLNVVSMAEPKTAAETAFAGILHASLAAITRAEATKWADQEIRINAVGPKGVPGDKPGGACLTSEPDIAALALYLASKKGRQLSGHVFDAEGVAGGGC